MVNVSYKINLTGSKLFDMAMYVEAMRICERYPGLQFRYHANDKLIELFGELSEENAAAFETEMNY